MEFWKHDVASSSPSSSSVINDERSRQPIPEKRVSLSIRVRGIDCMLADIEAQIEMLRRERTYLSLVRAGLAGMDAKQRASSPCNISLKDSGAHVRVEAVGSTYLPLDDTVQSSPCALRTDQDASPDP